ncbi:MAG TPA: hypothetical protein VK306_13320 [Acidimicrobiales bacterium]|nr:hypothetical protein [Acidimicrobiales bacterium]
MTATPHDELASAVLDGRLTGDDEAAALRDPAVARRVAQMRAARDALRSAPAHPPDAERREQAVAAALAAFDATRAREGAPADAGVTGPVGAFTEAAHPSPTTAPSSGPSLDERRARRDRRAAVPRWLAAAAALIVVIALGGALATLSSSPGDDEAAQPASDEESQDGDLTEGRGDASAGAAEDDEAARSTAEGAEEPTAAPDRNSAEASPSPDARAPSTAATADVDLGAAATGDDLASRAAETATAGGTLAHAQTAPGAGGQSAPASCPLPGAAGEAPVLLRGRATLAGEPVQVWVLDVAEGSRVLVTDASCAVVVDRDVPD